MTLFTKKKKKKKKPVEKSKAREREKKKCWTSRSQIGITKQEKKNEREMKK